MWTLPAAGVIQPKTETHTQITHVVNPYSLLTSVVQQQVEGGQRCRFAVLVKSFSSLREGLFPCTKVKTEMLKHGNSQSSVQVALNLMFCVTSNQLTSTYPSS